MLVYQRVAQTSSGKLKQPGDVSWLSWEFQELVPLWFSETPFIKAVLWKMIQRHTRPCRCWIWRWQLTEQGWEVLSCSIWFTHGIVWKGSPKSTDSWSCSLLFHIQIAVLFFFSRLRVFDSSKLLESQRFSPWWWRQNWRCWIPPRIDALERPNKAKSESQALAKAPQNRDVEPTAVWLRTGLP